MLKTLDEDDFLVFFGCEPTEYFPEEGFCAYQLTDKNGTTLIFSLNEIEGSVQVRLVVNGNDIALISEEGLKCISVQNDALGKYLRCDFEVAGSRTEAKIFIDPYVKTNWATLLV